MTAAAPTNLHLRFGDIAIEITADDERLVRRVAEYFAGFVTPGFEGGLASRLDLTNRQEQDPGLPLVTWDAKGKESYGDADGWRIVRKDRTGVLVTIHGKEWSMSGPLGRNLSQVINVIGAMYGLRAMDGGGTMIHASFVARKGKGIAVMGQSGAGKSSVAVRLLEEGFDFVSNDRLIVERSGLDVVGYGLPKLPRVNPGTLLGGDLTSGVLAPAERERYRSMPREQLWQVEDKYDLDVEGALGRRWLLSAPVACVLNLEWRLGQEGLTIERLRPEQSLRALRGVHKDFGCMDQMLTRRTDTALRETAERVPVFRVTGGADPAGLARAIGEGQADGISELI